MEESIYLGCPISINHKRTMDDILELDMVYFDVILGINLLHACFASIDCIIQIVKFTFQMS